MAKQDDQDERLINVAIEPDVHDKILAYRETLDTGMGAPPIRRVVQALILEGLAAVDESGPVVRRKKRRPA